MLFSWEHLKYQNSLPGAHFGTSLGGSWGGGEWNLDLLPYYFKQDKYSTVGGDGGCRVGEVRAGITSLMPDHKGFKLQ